MRAILVFSLLIIAAPVRPAREQVPEESKPLHEQILGEWVMIRYTRNGELHPYRAGDYWTFNGVEIHFRATDGETADETYCLNATKSPASMDFVNRDTGARGLAIVMVEEGQLTVCWRPSCYSERPTTFASPPESGIRLAVFARRPKK